VIGELIGFKYTAFKGIEKKHGKWGPTNRDGWKKRFTEKKVSLIPLKTLTLDFC
jgi:hypothetical protein